MKKILIFCVVMACSGIIYAQSGRTQFGLKGGLNWTNLNYKNGSDGNYNLAWHAGMLAHIHLTKQFALQPEVMYSAQGASIKGQYEYDIKLNYINVPVLLQYMTGSGFRIQTGPQVGYLLHAENQAPGIELDVNSNYKKVDFSWTFGAGYKFASGFGIDARYNHGLTDVNEENPDDIQNRAFQVGVFYQFKN